MYRVLARKWRPQTFDELVGQPQVARTLTNAIETDRLAHAYIFAGLRGTGKTTVARILAKCLNCEKGPAVTPCNRCSACAEIADSRAIDVLEIDAASRTKVEQTRELLEVVSYAPARDRYKILIVDEAHMLSKASFNALLKTLEEPPPNVVFVLATTELQKVLPTILSRCQVFEFRRVGAGEVASHLRKICEAEKIEISDAALERLARSGEGSVRDSLSLLERAVAFCGQKVEDDDVLRMLGAVRAKVLVDLIEALARRDAGGMLRVLDGLVDEGHDLVQFWNALIAALRDLMLQRALPDAKELLSMPADEATALARAAEGLSQEDLTRAFQILADLEPGLKSSAQPRFLFEATLVRLASLGAVRPIEEFLLSLGERPAGTAPAREKKKLADSTSEPERVEGTAAGGCTSELVAAVRNARPMLAAMLEQASTLNLSGGELLIRFPPAMEAVKRQMEGRESSALLRVEAERLAGGPVNVRVELGAGATTSREPPAPPGPAERRPAAARTSTAPDEVAAGPESGDLLERAQRDPGVKKLLDVFGAHVVDIRRPERPTKSKRKEKSVGPAEDAP